MRGAATAALCALLLISGTPASGRAQAGPEQSPTPVQEADTAGVSPGGAFLRSLLVPGWGQAAVGAYPRGGFYFLTAGATGWMLAKTAHFLDAAEERRSLVRSQVLDELRRGGTIDPDSLTSLLEADERMEAAEDLVEVRSQQMEDWTAFGIFWLFLNAADAFVSAHLEDFPTPLGIEALPGGRPGAPAARLKLSVPIGGPPRP